MQEKGPLEKLLQTWQTPVPRGDFEKRMLQRFRDQPVPGSFWQRWFVDPWEYAGSRWRAQGFAMAGLAVVLLLVGVALNAPKQEMSTDFGLSAVSTFPPGSFTQAYLEMVQR